ncbi:MAG: hypothetical protein WA869_13190 [Alloacidobacterium sp.]
MTVSGTSAPELYIGPGHAPLGQPSLRLAWFHGSGSIHFGTVCEGHKTIPPRGADPKHPRSMLDGCTVVPGQRGCQDSRDIDHSRVVGGVPFHRRVWTDLCPQPRLNIRTGAICQREEGLTGKSGAAEEHAYLRKREPRPVQGDPRGVTDDHEPAVPVTPRAVRWQTEWVGAPRQKVAPERAVLCQVRLGDPRPNVLVFHDWQSGVLSPLRYP